MEAKKALEFDEKAIDVQKLSVAKELLLEIQQKDYNDYELGNLGISKNFLEKLKKLELDDLSLQSIFEFLVILKTFDQAINSTNKLFKIIKGDSEPF